MHLLLSLPVFSVITQAASKTDNSIEIWLKQDDPALTFYNKFKKNFGNEEFLLITIDDEDIFSTENIRLISRISSELIKLKGISDVTSLSTIFRQKINTPYFKELLNKNKPLTQGKNGDPQHYKIPDTYEKSGMYLDMASIYGSSIVDNFYTPDQAAARISIRMKQVGSDRYSRILYRINDYIANNMPQYISMKTTGVVHLLIKMQDYLLASQIKTFSLAFVTIFIVMICLLRSIKLALISMIPNITPIILTIGTMGFMGIKLDAGTIMVASVAIGIAVDDTIHFLYQFKQEFKQRVGPHPDSTPNLNTNIRDDYIVSIGQTFRHVGRPIIFTSIIAFCGFLALCLSQFKPIQYFGLLTAITMVSALIADLLIPPCCLLVFQPMRRTDN